MSNQYQYTHCQPFYHACQKNTGLPLQKPVPIAQQVMNSPTPTIYHPNPFAPHGGAREWCNNDLLLHDVDLRRIARVRPLDCGIREMYILNPVPKL